MAIKSQTESSMRADVDATESALPKESTVDTSINQFLVSMRKGGG